jgi:hypothetical protein
MPEYRIYTLKNGRNIAAPPEVVEWPTDLRAIEEAKILLDRYDIEVWQGERLVIRLRPDRPRPLGR